MKKIIKTPYLEQKKEFEQSNLETRFATPESILTANYYRVEKVKFG